MPSREPEIVSLEPSATAVIRETVPVDRLPEFFDRAFRTLAPTLARQGTGIAGAAFALYHGRPADTADLEVGFPTVGPATPDGDIVIGSLPGGRVARLVHSGGFEGLGESWTQLGSWIAGQGLTPGGTFWEVYLTEPAPDMDPAELRTELNWPVTD